MSTKKQKQPRASSKSAILDAAVSVARDRGLHNFFRTHVAKKARTAEATVSWHFGDMNTLRREVVKRAVAEEILPILADVRMSRVRGAVAVRMSAALRKKVANHIARN